MKHKETANKETMRYLGYKHNYKQTQFTSNKSYRRTAYHPKELYRKKGFALPCLFPCNNTIIVPLKLVKWLNPPPLP
jgi:hypothetical protein